jgi:hypothetical protein
MLVGVPLTAPWAAARCTLETVDKYLQHLCEDGGGLPAEFHGKVIRARVELRRVYAQIVLHADTRPLDWEEGFQLARLGSNGEELPTLHTGVESREQSHP